MLEGNLLSTGAFNNYFFVVLYTLLYLVFFSYKKPTKLFWQNFVLTDSSLKFTLTLFPLRYLNLMYHFGEGGGLKLPPSFLEKYIFILLQT